MAKAFTPNKLLSRLSAADLGLLQPHLTSIDLSVRKRLEIPRRAIEHVYFPETGFVSVVADGALPHQVEVGLVGWEGMTGLAVVLGSGRSPNDTYVQSGGRALRIPASALVKAMAESASLRRNFLLYAHAFLVQVTQTARANARNSLEERLARWLLMAHDRLETDELAITHALLSVMLGVRRPGVTVALNLLEKGGLISTHRGVISVLDRTGLRRTANGAYGVAEAEYNRVFE